MKSEELRALQAPLKNTYRETPEAAVITLSAAGTLDGEGIACSVQTGKALVEAGLHPASGGERYPGLFRRHAARSARRLRRRHSTGGRHGPRDRGPGRRGSAPKAISISGEPSESTRKHRSDSEISDWRSTSIPTPMRIA